MYIGLDVHKKSSYYSVIDGQGTELKKGRFPTTGEDLDEFAGNLPEGVKMALEASTSGIFVYEYLDERGIEVHLAHPAYVKPFAKKHVKTDKVDARVLAQLLRMDYLPESYVPGKEIRDLRVLVRHRASLVRLRTSIKNRVHALLTSEGVQTPEVSDLFGRKGLEFLEEVKLQQSEKTALDNYLEVLGVLKETIKEVERTLKEKAEVTEEAKWLMSIIGIGFHNALLILSEIGEIGRFSKPESFVSYAGLAPKVEQSGEQVRYGHINKHSNGFLRWALIQSARAAVRSSAPNRFQRTYHKLKARRGDKVAIVAAARHMAESVYWVLTKEEYYKEEKKAIRASSFS
jgi:transposase